MQEQFVMVPVPADRVEEIYRVLARPREAQLTGGIESTAASAHLGSIETIDGGRIVGATDGWTAQALAVLYRDSSPAQRRFFDLLAERPGERVPLPEVSAAVGYEGRRLGGMLGGVAKRAAKLGPGVPWGWHHVGKEWMYFLPRLYGEVIARFRKD